MKQVLLFITLPILLLGSSASSFEAPLDNADQALILLDKMEKAIRNNTTIRCGMKKTERWAGKYVKAEYGIKAEYSTTELTKLYLYNEAPVENKGVEILYRKGENKGNCMVHPNGFPYVTVPLDPQGEKLRKKGAGHHCCLSVGFKYMGTKVGALRTQFKATEKEHVKYLGTTTYDGRPAYKVQLSNDDFKFVDYTVLKGENCVSIATKLNVGEDMIVQKNPAVSWYDDVKPGQVIKVPSTYGKSVVLVLDKETFLPVEQTIYDDEGLYENYRYYAVVANEPISDEEFKTSYKGYNF